MFIFRCVQVFSKLFLCFLMVAEFIFVKRCCFVVSSRVWFEGLSLWLFGDVLDFKGVVSFFAVLF